MGDNRARETLPLMSSVARGNAHAALLLVYSMSAHALIECGFCVPWFHTGTILRLTFLSLDWSWTRVCPVFDHLQEWPENEANFHKSMFNCCNL